MKTYEDQLIVVTGGAGFIGSSVIKHLNDEGIYRIIIIDDLGTDEKWKNLVGKRFIDIIPIQKCFEWLEGKASLIKAFIHLGACTSTVETNVNYLLENNFRFSQKLAEYAFKHDLRFIYASSAATYGDGNEGFSDEHDLLDSLKPLNMYGYSKHLFDLWLKNEGLLNKVVGLKYFNVFGPNEAHKGRMASAITHILPTAQKEGLVRLFKSSEPDRFSDGGQMRDFIYVKDVSRMTCGFLKNTATGIFNVGRGKPGTWNEIAHAVFKAIQKPAKIEYIPMPQDLIGKYQNYSCADMKKSEKALGNLIQCPSLENSVVEYIQQYLLTGKSW